MSARMPPTWAGGGGRLLQEQGGLKRWASPFVGGAETTWGTVAKQTGPSERSQVPSSEASFKWRTELFREQLFWGVQGHFLNLGFKSKAMVCRGQERSGVRGVSRAELVGRETSGHPDYTWSNCPPPSTWSVTGTLSSRAEFTQPFLLPLQILQLVAPSGCWGWTSVHIPSFVLVS